VGYSAGPLWEGALSTLSMFADQAALVVIAGVSVIYVAYYLGALGQKG